MSISATSQVGTSIMLEVSEDEMLLLDGEDFSSCSNVFTLPSKWAPYMCFKKPVDGRFFNLPTGKLYYPACGAHGLVECSVCHSVSCQKFGF